MKKNIFIILLIVLFAFVSLNSETDADIKSYRAGTVKVKGTDITKTFDLSGKVVVNRELTIKFPSEGVISQVHVIDGEWVTKGDKIITFSKSQINKNIKQNLSDIKKWEKILKKRQNWKVREKSSEDSAKENIKDHKAALGKNREFLKDPVIRTKGEGKVHSIKSKGDKVSSGSVLAAIVDDYVMKITVPSEHTSKFFKGMRLDIEFPREKIKSKGRVGNEGGNLMIFVNNPDLKISSGMEAVFSVTKKSKNVVLIKKGDFKSDISDKPYIYISDGKKAVKKYIAIEKFKESGYIVTSGLNVGETIVSPIVDIDVHEFLLDESEEISGDIVERGRPEVRRPRVRKGSFSLGKKMEYVVSAGVSFTKPETLIIKNSGIDTSVSQYTDIYGLTYTSTGEFKENLMGIPISLMVNYKLSDGLYLKFGGEFSRLSNSSSKSYSISWPGINENMDFSLKNSITNLMPFVGIEKRFSSFGIYAIVGLNLSSFNQTNTLNVSDGSNNMESVEEIKAGGTGIGINIGAKYMIKFKDKFGIFIKLEYALQTVGSFSGDKTTTVTDSYGGNYSTTESGSIYLYDLDPYGKGGFGWWDIHNTSPSGDDVSNVSDFSMNISRIRFLVGFSF